MACKRTKGKPKSEAGSNATVEESAAPLEPIIEEMPAESVAKAQPPLKRSKGKAHATAADASSTAEEASEKAVPATESRNSKRTGTKKDKASVQRSVSKGGTLESVVKSAIGGMDLEEELELEEGSSPKCEPKKRQKKEKGQKGPKKPKEQAEAVDDGNEAEGEGTGDDNNDGAEVNGEASQQVEAFPPKRRRITAPTPLALPTAPPAALPQQSTATSKATTTTAAVEKGARAAASGGAGPTVTAAAPPHPPAPAPPLAPPAQSGAKAARDRAKEQNLSLFAAFADGAAFSVPKLKPKMSLVAARKNGLLPGSKK